MAKLITEQLLLARVPNPEAKSADDAGSYIYVINTSKEALKIRTSAQFMQTADEEEAVIVGPKPQQFVLKPGEARKVGDVLGWELDFALGFIVEYKQKDKEYKKLVYNMKMSGVDCILPVLNIKGTIYKPFA